MLQFFAKSSASSILQRNGLFSEVNISLSLLVRRMMGSHFVSETPCEYL